MHLFPLILTFLGLGLTAIAYYKSKTDQFYTNTFPLASLGIYIWGDALVLGPFWAVSGLIFLRLSALNILRYLLLFYVIRSLFEVIYWLNHQAVKSAYHPPLPKFLNHLKPQDAAILYQLTHTIIIFFSISALVLAHYLEST